MVFQSTVAENFQSWDKFLDAYYEPIRTALGLIPFVGEAGADDLAQSFFLKLYERDILEKRPAITGRFRNWLYVAARAPCRRRVAEVAAAARAGWMHSTPKSPPTPAPKRPTTLRSTPMSSTPLSVLHMTVDRVRKHLLDEGKSEHWMIFEELVLAPLIPGRRAQEARGAVGDVSRPGAGFSRQPRDDRQAGLPADSPRLDPCRPHRELKPGRAVRGAAGNPRTSKNNRLWLAFLINPMPAPDESTGSSLEMAVRPPGEQLPEATVAPDVLQDELRVLLGFWLEMPMQ